MSESPRPNEEHEPADADDRPVPLDEPDHPDPPIDEDEDAERAPREAEKRPHRRG